MAEELSVELVKENQIIYNNFLSAYRIPQEKLRPADVCIRKWTSLREKYVKTKRKLDFPSGSGTSTVDIWPLYQALQFLDPYVVPRPTRSSETLVVSPEEFSPRSSPQHSLLLPSLPTQSPNNCPLLIFPSSIPLPLSPTRLHLTPSPVSASPSPLPLTLVYRSFLLPRSSTGRNKRYREKEVADAISDAVSSFKNMCEKQKKMLVMRKSTHL